jgi:hypothetical protein
VCEAQVFVVRFARQFFYAGRNHVGAPLGVQYPSVALTMTYEVACEVAKNLRDRGYADGVVCTQAGLPAKPEDIINAAASNPRESEEYARVWGDDPVESAPEAAQQ